MCWRGEDDCSLNNLLHMHEIRHQWICNCNITKPRIQMTATTTTTAIVIIIIIIAIAYLERVVGVYVLARIYGHTTVAASGFGRGVYPLGRVAEW